MVMRKLFVLIVFLLSSQMGICHNSKISTYTLVNTGKGWYVEMAFAQSTIDAVMQEQFGYELEGMSRDEYKANVIDYIKRHFELVANGEIISLGEGGILLGNHQTDMKFVLPGMPINLVSLDAQLSAFENSHNHTNILRVYENEKRLGRFFLSSDNDFSLYAFTDGNVLVESAKSKNTFLFIINMVILVATIVLTIVAFRYLVNRSAKTKLVLLGDAR